MTIRFVFKKEILAVGTLLMAVAAGIRTQIAATFSGQATVLECVAVVVFVTGFLTAIGAFVNISFSSGKLFPIWRADLVERALRKADPQATISILQTSFPNVADLIPLFEELLLKHGKHFKIRLLLTNPFVPTGKAVIAARMRLRDQTPEHHELEIEDHIKQFKHMKAQVDAAWHKDRDQAKLDLQIRLYDHLPFGPHYHIGQDMSFIGFFVSKCSSFRAPMLQLRKGNGATFEVFQDDFRHAWDAALPHVG